MSNKEKKRYVLDYFRKLLPDQVQYIGLQRTLVYWFVQRILRINSHVPWPAHWSSIVSSPEKIMRNTDRPYPGFMPAQYIQAMNGIIIGGNVRLGPGVKLISASHNLVDFDVHNPAEPIIIGDNCWLGADSIILPGVNLGEHTVVGAGAVVTKSFKGNCLVAGVPAQHIKELPEYARKEKRA